MDSLTQDLKYAIRQLLRSPAFAVIAIATLGLGIGVNTAVFSLVNALLFRPLPGVEAPQELVAIYTDDGGGPSVSSYMDFLEMRRIDGSLSRLGAFKPRDVDITIEGETRRVTGMMTTHDYFGVVGLTPAAGRFFLPEEDETPGTHAVAVVSHSFWQNGFGGDPDAVGRELVLNGRAFQVVGIAPEGFRGTQLAQAPAVFVPMAMQPHLMPGAGLLLDSRGWGGIDIIARLRPGVSLSEARAELDVVAARLAEAYPRFNTGRSFGIRSSRDATMPPGVRSDLVSFSSLLLGLVGLVLLVACVNVANLLLARAARRRSEIAVRQALGAGRLRLVRQLLVESLVLSTLGAGLAVVLAGWSAGMFAALPLPFVLDVGIDLRVLGFAAALAVLTGVAFGLAPALRTARTELVAPLKAAAGGSGRQSSRASDGLVVVQVALCVVVLTTAGLFARSLLNLRFRDPGFETERVLTASIDPSLQGYQSAGTQAFHRQVLERIRALPGVRAAAVSSRLPGPDADGTSITLEGYQPPPDQRLSIQFSTVGPDYFVAMGIPMRAGRGFGSLDREGDLPALILNESAADRFEQLSERPALGSRISVQGPEGPFMTVVGVAADSRTGVARQDPVPHMYVNWEQFPPSDVGSRMALIVLATGRPETLAGGLRESVHGVDANVPVMNLRTLDSHLADGLAPERLATLVLAGGGLLALLLAALGLYGVLAARVSRRTSELGLRMALGANQGDLLRGVVGRGVGLTAIGLALGLIGALAVGNLTGAILYDVSARDPATLTAVAVVLLIAALAASYLPARRATRVDPVTALRYE